MKTVTDMQEYRIEFFERDEREEVTYTAPSWEEALQECKRLHPNMTDWILCGKENDRFFFVGPYDFGSGNNIIYTFAE